MKNIDSKTHLRGESIYVDDIPLIEGTLFGFVFDSPIAHGKIKSLDFQDGLSSPGVIDILTKDDIAGENQIGGIIPDEPLFADGEVHFLGQPIAFIVAESELLAREAASKIKIELESLPVITDPREAYKKGQLIFPGRTFQLGDVDKAWDNCEHVFEGEAETGGQEQLYIETQGAYAYPTENGGLKIHSSTQGPTAVHRTAARVIGLPMHKIEVNVTRLGGGFGGKEDQATPWAVMAALAAHKLQRPVKYILHRLDDMRMTGKRHPYSSDFKIGLDKDYKIKAYEVTFYQNGGAAADLSPAVMERTLFHATNSYYVPNVKANAYSCKTNLPPNTAFRGFGGPQGMFVIEAAMAKAAEELGVDASVIQKTNLLQEQDEFPYGQKAENCEAINCWDKTEQLYEIKKLREEIKSFNQENKQFKKGIS
ncbi:MAG: molybdopterin-dependent oxidoreductase, partial [Bacteroidetes bacterium]|nr:molybdopterin-dependent oxidoreductase [Bacteroidota bacterium]